jgi:hypothetical protein
VHGSERRAGAEAAVKLSVLTCLAVVDEVEREHAREAAGLDDEDDEAL